MTCRTYFVEAAYCPQNIKLPSVIWRDQLLRHSIGGSSAQPRVLCPPSTQSCRAQHAVMQSFIHLRRMFCADCQAIMHMRKRHGRGS